MKWTRVSSASEASAPLYFGSDIIHVRGRCSTAGGLSTSVPSVLQRDTYFEPDATRSSIGSTELNE